MIYHTISTVINQDSNTFMRFIPNAALRVSSKIIESLYTWATSRLWVNNSPMLSDGLWVETQMVMLPVELETAHPPPPPLCWQWETFFFSKHATLTECWASVADVESTLKQRAISRWSSIHSLVIMLVTERPTCATHDRPSHADFAADWIFHIGREMSDRVRSIQD